MITKFKLYEKYEDERTNPIREFKEGNYIVLSPIYVTKQGQIIHVTIGKEKFIVEVILNDKIEHMRIYKHDIVRLMTPEEIEEFDLKRNSIKYNI